MKKLLLILSFLTLLISSTYAVDCMVEAEEHDINVGLSKTLTYGPLPYGTTKMSIEIKKSNAGVGTTKVEVGPSTSNLRQVLSLQYDELGVSYKTFYFNTNTDDRYVKISGGTASQFHSL